MKYVKWLLLIAVTAAILLRRYLPYSWSLENGPIENAQVGILAIGMFLSFQWARSAKSKKYIILANFWAWMILNWLILIGRELSWGRVFFPPDADHSLLACSEIKLFTIMKSLPVILIVLSIYFLVKNKFYRIPFQLVRKKRFPVGEFIVTLLACVTMVLGEKVFDSQVVEEIVEAIMYISLIVMVIQANITKDILAQPHLNE